MQRDADVLCSIFFEIAADLIHSFGGGAGEVDDTLLSTWETQ